MDAAVPAHRDALRAADVDDAGGGHPVQRAARDQGTHDSGAPPPRRQAASEGEAR